jgi:hypothetical protein
MNSILSNTVFFLLLSLMTVRLLLLSLQHVDRVGDDLFIWTSFFFFFFYWRRFNMTIIYILSLEIKRKNYRIPIFVWKIVRNVCRICFEFLRRTLIQIISWLWYGCRFISLTESLRKSFVNVTTGLCLTLVQDLVKFFSSLLQFLRVFTG